MPATPFKADQEQSISGCARVINIVSSWDTFNAEAEKSCEEELSITSGPHTRDYKRSPAAGPGQPQGDSAALPLDHNGRNAFQFHHSKWHFSSNVYDCKMKQQIDLPLFQAGKAMSSLQLQEPKLPYVLNKKSFL